MYLSDNEKYVTLWRSHFRFRNRVTLCVIHMPLLFSVFVWSFVCSMSCDHNCHCCYTVKVLNCKCFFSHFTEFLPFIFAVLLSKSWQLLVFSVDALTDILDAFVISENAAKMRMARENAGNDMLKVMQTVFPITVQIQMDVIKKYGFTADGDGV